MANKEDREAHRYWEIIAYPESMPENCIEEFAKTGIDFAHILHDKDIDLVTGELKKAHIHVLIDYGNNTTFKNMLKIAEKFFNVKRVEYKLSPKGAFNYLNHNTKDSRDKYQYPYEDIILHNDFDPLNFVITSRNKQDMINEVKRIVEVLNIINWYQLISILGDVLHDFELQKLCTDNVYLTKSIVDSYYLWQSKCLNLVEEENLKKYVELKGKNYEMG